MSAQLVAEHGLTINDYECLLHLAQADEGRMRRIDLAERLILTPSGVTRLLDGLEQAGWVERASCASDRRVAYAVLTDTGRAKLQGGPLTSPESSGPVEPEIDDSQPFFDQDQG